MEQQKLRDLLETLHQELEQVETIDEKTGSILTSLREDIEKLVQDGPQDEAAEENLVERMNEAIGHFEEEHPRLSIMIQHVLDSLAKMGL
jgi:cytochrome c-type biogenesis protein CcmH/NrfF